MSGTATSRAEASPPRRPFQWSAHARSRARRAVLVGLLPTLFLLFAVSFAQHSSQQTCSGCGSHIEHDRWYFRLPGDVEIPVSPTVSSVARSDVLDLVYGGDHTHTWAFVTSNEISLLGPGYVACGGPRLSTFSSTFFTDASFREFVLAKIADEELSLTELRTMLAVPGSVWTRPNAASFTAALEAGDALLIEAGGPDAGDLALDRVQRIGVVGPGCPGPASADESAD